MNRAPVFELNLTRRIRAPREKVFDAFVKPELMKAWMCPRGMSVPEVTAEARPGGRFRVTMRARDRESFVAFGEYREVSRPERLVYTWQWEGAFALPAETLITVSFSERDGETEVRMHHTGFVDAPSRDSHSGGWNSSYNRLADALDARGSAASVTLLGDARSSYVRTARMGLAEKGVKYTLAAHGPHTPEIDALHPFGRVPAFRDGEMQLFETSAILRYVEEAFDGPSLLPFSLWDRARCEQWVSAVNSYLYDAMIRRCVLKDIASHLAILDRAYGEGNYLAGPSLSMADLFLAPILACVEQMPEGKELFAKVPNVRRAQAAIRERPSFRDTVPPPI
jgi:glutathione S-transferase